MYFLGVDGGQSSTQAVIGDGTGKVLGRGSAGPCNHVGAAEGEAKLRRVISEVLEEARADAGVPADSVFESACFGMSGGPDDKRRIIGEVINAKSIEVVTDAEIALAGAAAGGPGIVVVAGTGSIAYGKSADGRTARVGGWGYIFGDEGGAFDIVRQALRKALASEEGCAERTKLRESLLTATSSTTLNETMHRFYTDEWPKDRIAALAPLVDEIAAGGDAIAIQVLAEAGSRLGKLAGASYEVLSPDCSAVLSVYPTGGVFQSEIIREAFELHLTYYDLVVEEPRHDAGVGGLILAYQAAGKTVEIK